MSDIRAPVACAKCGGQKTNVLQITSRSSRRVHTPGHSVVRLASGGDWYNGFEHDPEEAARVRVRLLRGP